MSAKYLFIKYVVLVCFIFNTAVCDAAMKLSPPLLCDNLIDIQHKDIGRIKLALESNLRAFSEIAKSRLPVDIETIREVFKVIERREETIYQPADMQFFFAEAREIQEGIRVMCRVKDDYGERTYYAVYDPKINYDSFVIKGIYTEKEYEDSRFSNLLSDLPRRQSEDEEIIGRYIQQEKKIDRWIQERMRDENNFMRLKEPRDLLFGIYGNRNYFKLNDALGGKLSFFLGQKEIILIRARGDKPKIMEDGKEIFVNGHSSNNAIYVFVDENPFIALKYQKDEKISTVIRSIYDRFVIPVLIHEIGAGCGLPWRVDEDGKIVNDLDMAALMARDMPVERMEYLNLIKNLQDKLTPVNLDHLLTQDGVTRDYAEGEGSPAITREFIESVFEAVQRIENQRTLDVLCRVRDNRFRNSTLMRKDFYNKLRRVLQWKPIRLLINAKIAELKMKKEFGSKVGDLKFKLEVIEVVQRTVDSEKLGILIKIKNKQFDDSNPIERMLYRELFGERDVDKEIEVHKILQGKTASLLMDAKIKELEIKSRGSQDFEKLRYFKKVIGGLKGLEGAEFLREIRDTDRKGLSKEQGKLYDAIFGEGRRDDIAKVRDALRLRPVYLLLEAKNEILKTEKILDSLTKNMEILQMVMETEDLETLKAIRDIRDVKGDILTFEEGDFGVIKSKIYGLRQFHAIGKVQERLKEEAVNLLLEAKIIYITAIEEQKLSGGEGSKMRPEYFLEFLDRLKSQPEGQIAPVSSKQPDKKPAPESSRKGELLGKIFKTGEYIKKPGKKEPGKSPEAAKRVIALSGSLRKILEDQGWFTLQQYLDAYREVYALLGFEALAEHPESTARRDLYTGSESLKAQGVLEIVTDQNGECYIPYRYELTDKGRAEMQALKEIDEMIPLADRAGRKIPTHQNYQYTLLMTSEFFANGELENDQQKYRDRFNLDSIEVRTGTTHEEFIDRVLSRARGVENRTIVLLSDQFSKEEELLQKLTDAGIRFIMTDTEKLLGAQADTVSGSEKDKRKKAEERKQFQRDTYVMMLLARHIKEEDILRESSIYRLLSFYVKSHFRLDGTLVKDYIDAIANTKIAVLIKGFLAYRPAAAYQVPEYDKVAATLIAA